MNIIKKITLVLLLLSTVNFAKIGIIVNKSLYSDISSSVKGYIGDLRAIEGKDVWLDTNTFNSYDDEVELKDSIIAHYENDSLEGVIFIGDLPVCTFEILNDYPQFNFGYANWPCDLYFMDLDGKWSDYSKTRPMRAGYYDNHSGNKAPEIWVSRIVPSAVITSKTEAEVINDYFARVKDRMAGNDLMPRKYLLLGNTSAWAGLMGENKGELGYTPTTRTQFSRPSDTKTNWGNNLVSGYEYAYIFEHSGPTTHCTSGGNFYTSDYFALSGGANVRFYNLFACSNAKYTVKNFGSIYCLSDAGLVTIGSSKSGSMLIYTHYNKKLGEGKSFGEAFKNWMIMRGIQDVSWSYGMCLQGVGTLKLQPYDKIPDYISVISPNGGEILKKGLVKEISWIDNIDDSVKIELMSGTTVVATIANSTESDGLYSWNISNTISSGNYTVKITSIITDTLTDESDAQFAIEDFTATLIVQNGVGGGIYDSGDVITVTADAAPVDKIFRCWSGDIDNLSNLLDSITTVTMPKADVTIKATYVSSLKLFIPGIIEAENYCDQFGVLLEDCKDLGGGQDVTGLYIADWMEYYAYVKASGDYTVKFRVASQAGLGNFDLVDNKTSGQVALTTVNVPNTGGIQRWSTVTKTVSLTEGYHSLLIDINEGYFAINKITFAATKPLLFVQNGTGTGMYDAGTVVDIVADNPSDSIMFETWSGDISKVSEITNSATTITMPNEDVDIEALYKSKITLVNKKHNSLPQSFSLSVRNGVLHFAVPVSSDFMLQQVKISLYDLRGRQVAVLVNGDKKVGYHELSLNQIDGYIPSGLWIISLVAGDVRLVSRITVE